MRPSTQYLEQLKQTALQLHEIANKIDQDAKYFIQENAQINGQFQDQDIANDTFCALLYSTKLNTLASELVSYCEQRLSDGQ